MSGRDEGDADLIPRPRTMESRANPSTYGDWQASTRLVDAPGAYLFRASTGGSNKALLQTIDLRPARSKEEEALRTYVDSLLEQSARASKEQDLELLDSGVTARPDGSLTLYWVMPWQAWMERVRVEGPALEVVDELVILAHDLLERMVPRHERNLVDPLLSEATILTRGEAGSAVLGFPVAADPQWMESEMSPPRVAPFERRPEGLTRTKLGDLYRLGRALEEMGRHLGSLPGPLIEVLRRYQRGSRGGFASAAEALEDLEAQDRAGTLGIRPQTLSTPRIASAQTVVEPRGPGIDVRLLRDHGKTDVAPAFSLAETQDDAPNPEFDDNATIAVEPPRRTRDSEATLVMNHPAAVTKDEAQPPQNEGPQGTMVGVRVPDRRQLDDRRLQPPAEDSDDLPPLRRRGSHPSDPPFPIPHAAGGGPAALLPGPELPTPSGGVSTPAEDDDLPDVDLGHRTPLYIAAGIFIVGLVAVLGVELSTPPPTTPITVVEREVQAIRASMNVTLRADPETAVFYSAEDGALLGSGKTQTMVGKTPPRILVAAPDHVPVEVSLPQRGAVVVELPPAEGETGCTVRVRAPRRSQLEAVAKTGVITAIDDRIHTVRMRGAALLRARDGRGAWIVSCASTDRVEDVDLKPRSAPRNVSLTVTWPTRGEIFIDGEPQGPAPLTRSVPNAFVEVRAETPEGSVERWVPAFTDTEVELPEP